MESYNAPQDSGYQVQIEYGIKKKEENNSYGRQQKSLSLPMYPQNNQQPLQDQRSKCPKGAKLGAIGSCCGWECTRACALPN